MKTEKLLASYILWSNAVRSSIIHIPKHRLKLLYLRPTTFVMETTNTQLIRIVFLIKAIIMKIALIVFW